MSERLKLIVSSSPHIHGPESIGRVMWTVVIALIPASLVSSYFFGLSALVIIALCMGGCVAVEALFAKLFGKPITIGDGSAALTGLLLALNLPAGSPWWMILIGCLVAVGLAKAVFGGLGQNIFNPALVARVFLLISFPVQMTRWPVPRPLLGGGPATDALTGATPLGAIKEAVMLGKPISSVQTTSWLDMATGNMGGSLGEISAIALILGALLLLYKGYISWHTPVSFIGTVAVLGGVFHAVNPDVYPGAGFHMLAGGLMLGALFMATDMVTSPMTGKGQLIFGAGCGVITVVIRLWGGYPEGVSFAILLMNAFVPIIDRYTGPKKFGYLNLEEQNEGAPG